ncbi:Tad domain-containing protein [Bremerella sp. TYQ1]|nr:Tad domain-containing protein [Bremerella volcania]
MRISRCLQRQRQGYVLVLFAMLLWIVLGMAALVIDLGLARVHFRQMQSATDTAAIAGLREELTGDSNRDKPRWLAAQTFHPNIDQNFESYATQQSVLSINNDLPPSGGVVEDPRGKRWIPNLASNAENVPNGDLEYSETERTFIARIRRSAVAPVDGVRNDSMPQPYLFGRATIRTPSRPSEAIYRGICLRSASIASITPALAMGPPIVKQDGEPVGGVQYAASLDEWNDSIVHAIIIAEGKLPSWYSVGNIAPDQELDPATSPTGYVAIYAPSVSDRIVGFGFVIDGEPQAGHVAETNATNRLLLDAEGDDRPSLEEYHQLLSLSQDNFVQTYCLSLTPANEFLED